MILPRRQCAVELLVFPLDLLQNIVEHLIGEQILGPRFPQGLGGKVDVQVAGE